MELSAWLTTFFCEAGVETRHHSLARHGAAETEGSTPTEGTQIQVKNDTT